MPDPEIPTAPDREKIRAAIEKLSPAERASLEERVSHSYAAADREVMTMVTRNGVTFPTWSTVLSLPVPPGDTGPRCLRVRFPEDGAPDDDDV